MEGGDDHGFCVHFLSLPAQCQLHRRVQGPLLPLQGSSRYTASSATPPSGSAARGPLPFAKTLLPLGPQQLSPKKARDPPPAVEWKLRVWPLRVTCHCESTRPKCEKHGIVVLRAGHLRVPSPLDTPKATWVTSHLEWEAACGTSTCPPRGQ